MTDEAIQLFVPTYQIEECLQEIRECLEIGWTGLGYKTVQFEDAWRKYSRFPHAHFVNSATAGLHLAVKILKEVNGWADGDEIISTPITFVSTNHAILYERMKVVFADVDEYGCLDPEKVEGLVSGRTRAVMFVALGGNIGQLARIEEICQRRGLALILDAAHLSGSRVHGHLPGAEADVTVFSFQAVKNLPTADSGMICFKDPKLDHIARQQSWLGIDKDTYNRSKSGGAYKWYYDVPYVGHKFHGNSVMASIGLVQLKYLDRDNAFRNQLADWYDEFLAGVSQLRRVHVVEGCKSSRHLYQVCVRDRDEVLMALNSLNIFPGVHYRDNTEYPMYRYASGTCPNATQFSDQVLSLPMHLRMSFDDVERVSRGLIDVLCRHST